MSSWSTGCSTVADWLRSQVPREHAECATCSKRVHRSPNSPHTPCACLCHQLAWLHPRLRFRDTNLVAGSRCAQSPCAGMPAASGRHTRRTNTCESLLTISVPHPVISRSRSPSWTHLCLASWTSTHASSPTSLLSVDCTAEVGPQGVHLLLSDLTLEA